MYLSTDGTLKSQLKKNSMIVVDVQVVWSLFLTNEEHTTIKIKQANHLIQKFQTEITYCFLMETYC